MLSAIIEKRPSGTRQRLAAALAKNRSFVSQFTNPAYATPIPASHLAAIFDVCHFSPAERKEFLSLYAVAHPKKILAAQGTRVSIPARLPDLGDAERNRKLHGLVSAFVRDIAGLIEDSSEKEKW
ncbi:hypothetical protein [Aestuariivirga sp.]|uniref:hypothetical protein n=1 Tax=Aestuariivirga sp. TaxID=2650926 RepID=UPI003BAD2330